MSEYFDQIGTETLCPIPLCLSYRLPPLRELKALRNLPSFSPTPQHLSVTQNDSSAVSIRPEPASKHTASLWILLITDNKSQFLQKYTLMALPTDCEDVLLR